MNLLAGNAVYVYYSRLSQLGFVLLALLFWTITISLILFG